MKIIQINILVLLGLLPLIGMGQQGALEEANKKYEAFSFDPARDIYQKVLDKGFVSADLLEKLGDTYYFNSDYSDAAEIYGRLFTEYKEDAEPEYYFRYAQVLRSDGQYEKADSVMQHFSEMVRARFDVRARLFESKRDYRAEIKENSGRYRLEEFAYNSPYSDFAPSLAGEKVIFSSDRDTGNLAKYRHTWNSRDFLDLYQVDPDSAGDARITKLEGVNTRLHESTSALSPDGTTLYFTRNNFKEGKTAQDSEGFIRLKLFRAKLSEGEWVEVEELPFNGDAYSVAHPALSADGRELYFASDMEGSLGQSDIWRVSVAEDGTFGKPENLGPKINTEARETFPYVSSEGILYFSSDGHPGLGGLDVFATKLEYLSWKGAVQNVGAPVNTAQDDFTYIISDSTRQGYFASNRPDGMGSDDIYGFLETTPLNFDCLQPITGTVRDIITNELLVGATVRIIGEDNQEVSSAITDGNGQFEISRDCNLAHFIRASREGYIPSEEYLEPSDGKSRIVDFYLEPETVTAGYGDDLAKLLQLSTIYFDFDKSEIRNDAEIEIQKVIAAMEKYPSLKIKVNAHTDSRGLDQYNLMLSQKRAENTVKYMISQGISADRLKWEGYGETRLINSCDDGVQCTDEEHEKNRRSEFIIFE